MNAKDLKNQLQLKIEKTLVPLIDSNYVYWDLPYHLNIGDTLIWEGTEDFLKKINFKCLDRGNSTTANLLAVDLDSVILLHGGGNVGDIYISSQNFRKKIIQQYPNNKIIIFPQTVYFESSKAEFDDFSIIAQHNNLYLCVRDQESYDTALKYLKKDKVLLLPDMAFCLNEKKLIKNINADKKLFINRNDVEKKNINELNLNDDFDLISDWPTFEREPLYCKGVRYAIAIHRRMSESTLKKILGKFINAYAISFLKNKLIKEGFDFINGYNVIYTSRLHGCILSLLLDKSVVLLDNSYGKNSSFYNVWLKESDNIKVEKTC